MPFQIKNFQKEDSVSLQSIAGAYYWKNRSKRNGLSFKPEHVSLKTVHFSTHN